MNIAIELLKYIVPLVVLAAIVYLLLDKMWKAEAERQKLILRQQKTDHILPQRLQAYERMALFLERIRPTALVRRMALPSTAKLYEQQLISAIQEEFDHNLSQQIYVHPDTWKLIFSAKNAMQNLIKQCQESVGDQADAEALQQEIIRQSLEGNATASSALLRLQADVQGDF